MGLLVTFPTSKNALHSWYEQLKLSLFTPSLTIRQWRFCIRNMRHPASAASQHPQCKHQEVSSAGSNGKVLATYDIKRGGINLQGGSLSDRTWRYRNGRPSSDGT